MRDPHTSFVRLEGLVGTWLDALDTYTPEQFATAPAPDAWSMGQVYQHLIGSANNMQMANVRRCIAGAEDVEGGKTEAGEYVFASGALPPTQIKVPPSAEYTPAQPEDRQRLRREMLAVVEAARDLRDDVAAASPSSKMRHPGLGMLNAAEWYQLMEMHFEHHLRQKERLEQFLGMRS